VGVHAGSMGEIMMVRKFGWRVSFFKKNTTCSCRQGVDKDEVQRTLKRTKLTDKNLGSLVVRLLWGHEEFHMQIWYFARVTSNAGLDHHSDSDSGISVHVARV
jgi:hypothetical protein